ncbi:MAG: CotH kinase family protein [Candidatus Omnitrophica bacterium]|nr:CotH kinase family protein [Candidatus Omnitrophota bacterium]
MLHRSVCVSFTASRILLFAVSFLFSHPSAHADLWINEILASTDEVDEFGTSLEWIELYNSGDQAVNLLGYTLSDDPLAPGKWMFGAVEIPAHGYFLVWTTGYDLLDQSRYHANFRLDRDGEMLALYAPGGMELDAVHYPIQQKNISYGRRPDGGDAWNYFLHPTPGGANNSEGVVGFAQEPGFSTPGGIYTHAFYIELSAGEPDAEIRYTLDGSAPTESSDKYASPIPIQEASLVRARVFCQDWLPSPVATHTYIFRENLALPILSLTADPDDLFSRSKGIYANPEQHGGAWERPASVEFFSKDGRRRFQEDAGIRIHGGASRSRSPKKSFRLYFRSEYGSARLNYPLFPDAGVDKINQIVVRGGFNDTWGYDNASQRPTAIYVSDQVARDLHREMGQLACDGIFVELYLNGENWGIYNPSERIEEDFFEQHTGLDGWTVVADGVEVKDGEAARWDEYLSFIQSVSFAGADGLERLNALIDQESFTAFIILNTWIQNYDWPRHNWLCARPGEGPWIYQIWDMEYSFGSGSKGYKTNVNVYDYLDGDQPLGSLFARLIRNPAYQAYYWEQVDRYLSTALSEENVLKRLNARLDEIRDAIPWEAEKWGEAKGGDPEKTPVDWEKAAQQARDFVSVRTPIYLQQTERVVGPKPVRIGDWSIY